MHFPVVNLKTKKEKKNLQWGLSCSDFLNSKLFHECQWIIGRNNCNFNKLRLDSIELSCSRNRPCPETAYTTGCRLPPASSANAQNLFDSSSGWELHWSVIILLLSSLYERQKLSILSVRCLQAFQSRFGLCLLLRSHPWPCYSLMSDFLCGEEIKRFDWARKTHKFWNESKVTVLEWFPPRDRDWMDCSSNYVTIWSDEKADSDVHWAEFLWNYIWASEVLSLHSLYYIVSLPWLLKRY